MQRGFSERDVKGAYFMWDMNDKRSPTPQASKFGS